MSYSPPATLLSKNLSQVMKHHILVGKAVYSKKQAKLFYRPPYIPLGVDRRRWGHNHRKLPLKRSRSHRGGFDENPHLAAAGPKIQVFSQKSSARFFRKYQLKTYSNARITLELPIWSEIAVSLQIQSARKSVCVPFKHSERSANQIQPENVYMFFKGAIASRS